MRRVALAAFAVLVALLAAAKPPALRAAPPSDGRAGSVLDLGGVALVAPPGHDRWTPLDARSVLLPGDRVRTLSRGAHALEIGLAGGGRFLLGPGGLVEIRDGGSIRLLSGEMEVVGARVEGPGGRTVEARVATWLAARDRDFRTLDAAPKWLVGFRASGTKEWMGSLLADVDGRNVPLTIGYHKVSVVIRDQIAETTIEESFVNHTDATLEGTFSFPLPADASISGFGMWIGNELVMADVVERGRAREIYEDILRRRKDPGLLEWSGGNLFKARVFPIFGRSEKRIRLRYTQVLPRDGQSLRYRYALRSDLLKEHPLQSLQIRVAVQSALPLAEVVSPSHEATVRKTEHEAILEFTAEDVTPERDFEAVIRYTATPPLTVLPHRRGPDGYFLLVFSPPDPEAGGFARELAPEGPPVDILILADTSGSMRTEDRAAQADFVETLLSVLGPKDTFRLAAFDAETAWYAGGEKSAADPASTAQALEFLAARDSLGHTDLERALDAAMAAAGPGTHVIYVGDGVGTAGDPDPAALVRRIEAKATGAKATFHAVAPGTSYEGPVLSAIAAIGGGGWREVGGDPAGAARELLAEIARPPLKDLAVSFPGVRTARVYPSRLPNLPAGRQQIVLGRFLPPESGDARGEVVVTGRAGGEEVRFRAPFFLKAGEDGNSFLPRLWARRHIDALLAEKLTPELREEVVAFSAEFGIMTPLTSFLVLENDEDRASYGVERRVAMRDGERFFADARDAAKTEILRQALREAARWRQALVATARAEIRDLGRRLMPPPAHAAYALQSARASLVGGGGGGGRWAAEDAKPGDAELESRLRVEEELRESKDDAPAPAGPAEEPPASPTFEPASEAAKSAERFDGDERHRELGFFGGERRRKLEQAQWGTGPSLRDKFRSRTEDDDSVGSAPPLINLFPVLPPAVETPPPFEAPGWSAEAREILDSLDWEAEFTAYEGSLSIVERVVGWHPLRKRETSETVSRLVAGPAGWRLDRTQRGALPETWWCDGETRGALRHGMLLGRRRPAAEAEENAFRQFPGFLPWEYRRGYAGYVAEVIARDGDRATISFTTPDAEWEVRLVVDTALRVPLSQTNYHRDTPQGGVAWSDWRVVDGLPYAGLMDQVDAAGRTTFRWETTVEPLTAEASRAAVAAAARPPAEAIFLGAAEPTALEAKEAVAGNRAGFADRLVIALDHAGRGRWDEAFAEFDRAAALAENRPGIQWLRIVLFAYGRRGEALRAAATARAADLAGAPFEVRIGLAEFLDGHASMVLAQDERLVLLAALRAAVEDEAAAEWWLDRIDRRTAQVLEWAGRQAAALEIRRRLLAEAPDDPELAVELAGALRNLGRREEAADVLYGALAHEAVWLPHEADQVYGYLDDDLFAARRIKDLLALAERWVARAPAAEDAYEIRWVALLLLGRVEEMDREVLAALAASPAEPIAAHDLARLGGAIDVALGHGWNYYVQRLAPAWWKPLHDAALRLARRDDAGGNLADRILHDWRFQQTDAWRAVLAELRKDLFDDAAFAAMSIDRIQRLLVLFRFDRTNADDAAYDRVVGLLRRRVEDAGRPADKARLRRLLLGVHDQRADVPAAVDLLRAWVLVAEKTDRPGLVLELIDRLLQLPFAPAVEDEVFALLPDTAAPELPADQRGAVLAAGARRIAQGLFDSRVNTALGDPADRLRRSRAELAAMDKAAREEARAALATRFAAEAGKAMDLLAPWLLVEGLGFSAEAATNAAESAAVEGRARELLLSPPALPSPHLAWTLEERTSLVLDFLAIARDADPELVARTVALHRERIAAATNENRADRRFRLYRLLLALDRPADLIALLRQWDDPTTVSSGYRTALAYLLAETGDLADAARLMEMVVEKDEASAAEYDVLATWYFALGEDARREAALDRRDAERPEWELSNRLYAETQQVSRPGPGGVPPDLDPEVIRLERILFRKASHPQQYLWQVIQLYQQTKDFRLLAALADGVVGRSPQGIYPYLAEVWRNALAQVHEEATLDEVAARIGDRATGAEGADRRGLLYLTALVARRAAEVKNRPEVHAEKALPALVAAFPAEWLPGEPRAVATFLASLGRIPVESLAAEQLRQIGAIHGAADLATEDGLAIGVAYAGILHVYGRRNEAVDVLTAALDAVRAAAGGVLPGHALGHLETLADWLTQQNRFAFAEEVLAAERERQPRAAEKARLTNWIFIVAGRALARGGAVSYGEGEALYRGAFAAMEAALTTLPADYVDDVVTRLVELGRSAHQVRIGGVAGDFAAFARGGLKAGLARAPDQEQYIYLQVAEFVVGLGERTLGLTLLVEKIENDPEWYQRVGRDGWRQFAWRMSDLRHHGAAKGELAERLAKIVLAKLEEDLISREGSGGGFWDRDSAHFWRELAPDFATVARKVAEMWMDWPSIQLNVANYFWHGLHDREAAIDVLVDLDERRPLAFDMRMVLSRWLMELSRYAAALPHIEKLLGENPDVVEALAMKIRALAGADRRDEAGTFADETIARLKKQDRFTISWLSPIAEACWQSGLWDRGVFLFDEIARQWEAAGAGGRGDGRLSHAYGRLAECLVHVGRTEEAVQAAAAAVVAWGDRADQRAEALNALVRTIAALPDLPAFIAKHEAEAAKTGLDAPVMRKAFAAVWFERKEWRKAAAQLLVARELSPADREIHEQLVKTLDQAGETEAATRALSEARRYSPNDYALVEALADRYAKAGQAAEAERALTTLVEIQPLEAEGHSRLAQRREKAKRFDEAIAERRIAVDRRSFDPETWFALVTTLRAAGRADEAKEVLREMRSRRWSAEAGDVLSRIEKLLNA